ncbi:nitroreductase family protein [Streptomyces sp. NPDC026673]|uniref:nitroreductase family protein n=1 Tax=Streptomyces sp. NPDC026673 TaxID=3155724 RepID=UPI0033EF98B6
MSRRWEHRLTDTRLAALPEAARRSASANNAQPWRFLVGRRDDRTSKAVQDALIGINRRWAGDASALVTRSAPSPRPHFSRRRNRGPERSLRASGAPWERPSPPADRASRRPCAQRDGFGDSGRRKSEVFGSGRSGKLRLGTGRRDGREVG